MGQHQHITAEMTAHRQADLLERVERLFSSSELDAPDVLAAALRKRLDADLSEALTDIMGIYSNRNRDDEETLLHAESLGNVAGKICLEIELEMGL